MSDPGLRRLVRDQWVRLHGTPRITVLAGGERARRLWTQWIDVAGYDGLLLEGDVDAAVRQALGHATTTPERPVAVLASAAEIGRWRAGRTDRLAAMLDEGLLVVDDEASPTATARPTRASVDARSVAEATLHDALEATTATAGRFELNALLAVRFGGGPAEVDLLSRRDAIAIEIDGYHHFTDADGYRRDRRKDLLLQTQGFLVIRLLAEDVMRDVRAAVNAVCQALAYRLDRTP